MRPACRRTSTKRRVSPSLAEPGEWEPATRCGSPSRSSCPGKKAERLSARAIREQKNLEAVVAEILEAAE